MNDLEICKRIAEIEHGTAYIDGDDTGNFINLNHPMSDRGGEMYNPLTDDALWAKLIMKHEVSISFNFCLVSMITNKQYEMNFTDIPSLKRNTLLLIIKAHKESV